MKYLKINFLIYLGQLFEQQDHLTEIFEAKKTEFINTIQYSINGDVI